MEIFYGVVKFFNANKGYGFITEIDEDNIDYFVHFSSIKMDGYKTLEEGQEVQFNIEETEKGKQAINVVLDD